MTNFEQIEDKALHLSETDRAKLARKLLLSLEEEVSESEIAEEWLDVAQRRARELDAGTVKPIPAEVMKRKVQALLR